MKNLVILFSLLILPLSLTAADRAASRSISLIGRDSSVVTTEAVRLADIAEISSRLVSDDEAVIGLQKLQVGSSPKPGEELSISASAVLERMRSQGIAVEQISYSMPRIMKVKRASRLLPQEEIIELISSYLRSSGNEMALRNFSFPREVQLAPGDVRFEVQRGNASRPGRQAFNLTARVSGAEEVRFSVEAEADEWRQIPVASRTLVRGSVVGPEDIMMARMNLATLAQDAALETETVVGRELNRDMRPGDFFSRARLEVPPLVPVGSRVTMMSRSRFFEITASGTALEDGMAGSRIKVRNDSSKKILVGQVRDDGTVEVQQ